jgi:endoglucanase
MIRSVLNGFSFLFNPGLILFIPSFFLISACLNNDDTGAAGDQGLVPSDPFELNQAMQRGINLGNALEAPQEGDWGMVIREEYIREIAETGFDAIRIPVRWNAHADYESPYTIDPAFFNRVDEIIGWALDRDLIVMINIHHYDELMQRPHQHRQRFLAIWEQIAEHYSEYPTTLLFEILNEPHDHLTPELWNSLLAETIDIIRVSNPHRTLVIGTAPWGGFYGLEHLEVPVNDRNIIVTVHYYDPFQFTHQGAGWAGDEADEWIGTAWEGSPGEMSAIDESFNNVYEWANQHNRPIHLGEFGAYQVAPYESRILWTDYVRTAAEERNFSWAYWEFGAGFGAFDRESSQWREELLEALIP